MNTRFISAYIATATLFSVVALSGCRGNQALPDPGEPTVTQPKSEDGMITLAEPVTLYIGVSPAEIVDPMTSSTRANVGDFYWGYTTDERDKSTVNSKKPSDETSRMYKMWEIEGGDDWIHTLSISELDPKDYIVEGLVPNDSWGDYNIARIDESKVPAKVSVTLYKIPESRTLTFFANASVDHYVDTPTSYDTKRIDLSVDKPFRMVSPDWLVDQKQSQIFAGAVKENSYLFDSNYLPMYGRLTQVTPTNDGKIEASQFGEAKGVVSTIYLERAVAKVEIYKEYSYKDASGNTVTPVVDHVIDDASVGRFVNIMSIVPNNWAALQTARHDWTKEVGDPDYNYKHFRYIRTGWTEDTSWHHDDPLGYMQMGNPVQCFFVPENFPTVANEQSTILASITKLSADGSKIVKRRAKRFGLLYGSKNSKGLYEVHRNTIYRVHLRMKQTPEGPVTYIVDTWSNQDVDLPW